MAKGVNKVILLGNCGRDPEIKYLPDGNAVANLSLATSSYLGRSTSGESQEKTEWHRLVFFGKLAEVVGQYVKKGSQIYVEGSIRYGQYEKDGITRYTTDIIGTDIQFVGSKQDSYGRATDNYDSFKEKSKKDSNASNVNPSTSNLDDNFDDDIPF